MGFLMRFTTGCTILRGNIVSGHRQMSGVVIRFGHSAAMLALLIEFPHVFQIFRAGRAATELDFAAL